MSCNPKLVLINLTSVRVKIKGSGDNREYDFVWNLDTSHQTDDRRLLAHVIHVEEILQTITRTSCT